MADKKPNFEKDLAKLEETVAALEEGGLSLDDSLKRFESGITLARRCEKALTEAEKKIEILLKNAQGEHEPQPFTDDEAPVQSVAPPPPAAAPRPQAATSPPPAAAPEPAEEEEEDGLLF